jgi:hypothetical protein
METFLNKHPYRQPFENWLNKISRTISPPPEILAFNFGIFEGEEGYTVYLTGSRIFDPKDPDWACQVDYEPEENYLCFEDSSRMDWTTVQTLVETLVRDYLENHPEAPLLDPNPSITVGFDDGDLVQIR